MTDPIADLLTRIRNANQKRKEKVDVPASKIKESIVKILKDEGFIVHYKRIQDTKQGIIRIYLKYAPGKVRVIRNLKRISSPGRRVYKQSDKLPKVCQGLGIAVVSTSCGLMTDRDARNSNIGGEILCYVWWEKLNFKLWIKKIPSFSIHNLEDIKKEG